MDGCDRCSTNLASWYQTNEYVMRGEGNSKEIFGPMEENAEWESET
jgi:hypothetical protein